MCIEDIRICPYCRLFTFEPYATMKANSTIYYCDTPAQHVDREDQLLKPGNEPCAGCIEGNEDWWDMCSMVEAYQATHGDSRSDTQMWAELNEEFQCRKKLRAREAALAKEDSEAGEASVTKGEAHVKNETRGKETA